jgi:ATP-dependent Lon protease
MSETYTRTEKLPMIALRGLTMFPDVILTFDVEREPSLRALEMSVIGNRDIFLVAQKNVAVDVPEEKDMYSVGVVCRVKQQIRQPQSSIRRVTVEGLYRARAEHMVLTGRAYTADVTPLPDKEERVSEDRIVALVRSCFSMYHDYLSENPEAMTEQLISVLSVNEPSGVANHIAHNVNLNYDEKQSLLEELYPSRRLVRLGKLLRRELNILQLERELADATQEQMNQNQREYYLREEMKIIQAELGEDGQTDDIGEYRRKISALAAPDEIKEKLNKELSRLMKQPFGSSEAAVLRGYLDTCLELPWGKKTTETIDLEKARKLLDDEHFGLEKVKDRVIEYLAVKKLSPNIKGGLICLVGPPGTGKTSIAMSIAKAVNRKLVRVSLGGVHDEAEIRGHRKTYIGSMPGRIINGIIQAKSCNPLMVLDEIDKLGSDYRGDPSAALLEALDGEQNSTFRDNFLEIPFDLSEVFFITTANTLDTIPRALLDRMEIIQLASYTDEEKLQIAKRHLLPKQRKKHGLRANQLRVSDEALREIIRSYTRESGVRTLEREIARLCRRAACDIAEEKCKGVSVKAGGLEPLMGPAKFKPEHLRVRDEVGLVRGLAYTSVGGEVLDVEVAVVDGSGRLELTGNLGDVMKESARAAMTYIRSRAGVLGIEHDFYKTKDIHIHFPEGAVPKDGPSAGITVTIALISALTGAPVRHDVAMTGEITLRGRVLPIGGLREKTMAAMRAGVKTVIIPADNEADLENIDQTVRRALEFVPTDHVDKVLDVALIRGAENSAFCPPQLVGVGAGSAVRQ